MKDRVINICVFEERFCKRCIKICNKEEKLKCIADKIIEALKLGNCDFKFPLF